MWAGGRRRRAPRIADEIAFHRDRLIETYIAQGAPRDEAERRAFLELGSPGAIEESVRDVRGRRLEDRRNDLRYALRTLRRNPVFAIVAVLTLALGVGANAAVVSIVYGILLKPLPVSAPDQLVNIVSPGPRSGPTNCNTIGTCEAVFSYPMFRDLQRVQDVFTGIAAHSRFDVNLTYRGESTRNPGLLVSGSYFPVLGLQPALGRLLGPDDDRNVGGSEVVVLSHAYWTRRFGSADVIGDTLVVNQQPMTIVGVAPREFEGTTVGLKPDVYVPITMRWRLANGSVMRPPDQRRAYWLYLFARLKPDVPAEQAQTAIDTPYRAILNQIEAPLQEGMSDAMMAQFKAKGIRLDPGSHGQSTFVINARMPLTLLAAFTTLVLLVACLNVTNLVLVRAAARSKELATRLSIGATRGRLIAQLMTESFVLAIITAGISLIIAQWTLGAFRGLLPEPGLLPRVETDIPLVAAGLAVLTSLIVGFFPALHATRPGAQATSRGRAAQATGDRRASRARVTLATAQVAMAMVLVVLAGLFTKSLANIFNVDWGLDPDDVIAFRLSPGRLGYADARSAALFERVEAELAALPGVSGLTSSTTRIFTGDERAGQVFVEGFDRGPDADRDTRYDEIGSHYFRTLGIPLTAGREFTPADSEAGPRVAVVNETFARKFGAGGNVLGRRMSRGTPALDLEIVGVVKDFKQSVRDAVAPMYFVPHRQGTRRPGVMVFYVRSSPDALGAVVPAIRAVARRLDSNLPVEDLWTLNETIRAYNTGERVMSVMTGAFAVLSLLVAAIGLYGLLSYNVSLRTPEIGVRLTLGATGRDVRWMIFRQVTTIAAAGGIIGLAIALLLGRVAQRVLYGLQFHDTMVIASSIAVLAVAALGAGLVPANRAAGIDPIRALKYD
jgi:predicted permease